MLWHCCFSNRKHCTVKPTLIQLFRKVYNLLGETTQAKVTPEKHVFVLVLIYIGWLGSRVVIGLRRRRARVQIAAVTLSGNSLRQTVHTHRASVQQAAKLVAALLRVAGVTAGLAESNGSLLPGLWLTSPAGWLPRTGISSGTLRSVIKYGLPLINTYSQTSLSGYHLSG